MSKKINFINRCLFLTGLYSFMVQIKNKVFRFLSFLENLQYKFDTWRYGFDKVDFNYLDEIRSKNMKKKRKVRRVKRRFT